MGIRVKSFALSKWGILFGVVLLLCTASGLGLFVHHNAQAAGATFKAPITHIDTDGNKSTIQCTFVIQGSDTCIVGANAARTSTTRAIDTTTEGEIIIPQKINMEALGVTYTVVGVQDYAFGGSSSTSCSVLTKVTLSDTIASIGDYAFAFCSQLEDINMPKSLQKIGDRAFYQDTLLAGELRIPSGVTSLGAYAFCRCKELSTVIFEGDCPEVGESAFTGSSMAITKLVFMGKSANICNSTYFNSENVDLPTPYYTVNFFNTIEEAKQNVNSLGSITVSSKAELGQIDCDLVDEDLIYAGKVPEWPEGTNLWEFEQGKSYSQTLRASGYAYSIQSDYRDLSKATISYERVENGKFLYMGIPVDLGMTVENSVGYKVAESNLDITYLRDGKETSDLVSPGTIDVVTKAKESSRYFGELRDSFDISFEAGCNFVSPVQIDDNSYIDCWFNLTSLSYDEKGNATGAVSVARGCPSLYTTDERGGRILQYPRAISQSYSGSFVIPEHIFECGCNLSVTAIESAAFGRENESDRYAACARITELEIPASMQEIGSAAFCDMVYLEKVSFRGDASTIKWGDIVFKNDKNVETVVWYGKKADNPYLFSTDAAINTSIPTNYYQVTFYKDEESVNTEEGKLGSAVLREDVTLAFLDQVKDEESGLYEGEIPAYPDTLIDDGTWYAPVWYFPEINDDNSKALISTISDSVSAYAAQTNDAYTLDDAFVFGIEEGQKFSYVDAPVITADKIRVSPACGRTLERDKDYTLKFQRMDAIGDAGWQDTDDLIDSGNLRLVIEGIGKYKDTRVINFSITAPAVDNNTVFKANVKAQWASGAQASASCSFLTRKGTANGVGEAWIYLSGNGSSAVTSTSSLEGATIVIPESVSYHGYIFKVVGITGGAFTSFPAKGIVLPKTMRTLETGAFKNVYNLREVTIEGCADSASNAFNDCSNIEKVVLGESVTTLPATFISGSRKIQTLTYSDNYEGINASFSGCTIASLHITPHMSQVMTIDTFSGVTSTKVTFDEGVTSIPDNALRSTNCSSVILPSTLRTIGKNALQGIAAMTSLELPASVESIASDAFRSWTNLKTIRFLGDAPVCDTSAFTQCSSVANVLFYGKVLDNRTAVFTRSATSFYSKVDFYASKADLEAGNKLSSAFVKLGTKLSAIQDVSAKTSAVFEGTIPDLPAGANLWEFEGNPCLNDTLSDSAYAFAKNADLQSLDNAFVVAKEGYKFLGDDTPIADPFDAGTARVFDALGKRLTRGTHYEVTYQRRDADGNWQDSTDLASVGRVRIVARAIDGGGYTGSCIGSFVIATHLTGETFTCDDVNGHTITYRILSLGDEITPGKVSVGRGQRSSQAVASDTTGSVVIPEIATDDAGFEYKPVTIGNFAFYRCMDIVEIQIPSTVTEIGKMAFAYVENKTDTKVSNLATVIFGNDMSKTAVAADAFSGCNDISTVVYKSKKGNFDAFGASDEIQFYYTVSYYLSKADWQDGRATARVTSKAGTYPYSLSETDYYPGSDKVPELESRQEWFYEQGALGNYDELIDSIYAYAYATDESIVVADVQVKGLFGSKNVECSFKRKQDSEGAYTDKVVVGSQVDGAPAIAADLGGTVVIPSTITDASGATYYVEGIGSYAFGASVPEQASNITGIEIPTAVTNIGQAAFANCSSLKDVTFVDGGAIQEIGSNAFLNCAALEEIDLPQSLQTISTAAFNGAGLKSLYIPAHVQTIGKRAFDACKSLKSIVFGAAMELKLDKNADPVALGADDIENQKGASSNKSELSLIDDYVFADCNALAKVVFNADMSVVNISEAAFDNCMNIETILFGDKSCKVPLPDQSHEVEIKTPKTYYTMSYFHRLDDKENLKRMAYVCVLADAPYDARDASTVLFGEEPQIEQYYEWIYGCKVSEPFNNSSYAYGAKIVFNIDLSGIDAAFDIEAIVNGMAAEGAVVGATYDDVVLLKISSIHNVQPGTIHVIKTNSGEELVSSDAHEINFNMPAESLNVSVDPVLSLTVTKESAKGEQTAEKHFAYADLAALSKTPSEAIAYSAWNNAREPYKLQAGIYVSLKDLFRNAGVSFEEGDSLVLLSGDDILGTISYDELYAEERSYYPNFNKGETDSAQAREPILALKSNEEALSRDDGASAMNMAKACQFIYGQTSEEALDLKDTYSNCSAEVTGITVLAGPEDISKFKVEGLEDMYAYTGDEIKPDVKLVSDDGSKILVKNTDYEVSYANNISTGVAHVKFEGISAYKGTLERSYRIIGAQEFTGVSSPDMAAEAALKAYASGCNGVVIANAHHLTQTMSAPSLCGLMNYPLLLTDVDELASATKDALNFLAASSSSFQVIVLGNEDDISLKTEQEIEKTAKASVASDGTVDVSRLGGKDAYETAYLSYLFGANTNGGWSDTVLVTDGSSYELAACASAFAAANKIPVLFAQGSSLDDLTLEAIGDKTFKKAIVLGSESAVSDLIYKQIEARFGESATVRIFADSIEKTSVELNAYALEHNMLDAENVAVVSAGRFPDAFVAGSYLACNKGMLVVTSKDDTSAVDLMKNNAANVCSLNIFGNILMVTQDMREAYCDALGWQKDILPEPATPADPPDKGEPGKKPDRPDTTKPTRFKAGSVLNAGDLSFVVQKNTSQVSVKAKNKKLTKAVVPSTIKDKNGFSYTVTSVASSGFASCSKLTQISGGSQLLSIGSSAFKGCSKLKYVGFSSKKLNSVGSKAFYNCKKLAGVNLSKTTKLKTIGSKAFYNTKALTSVKISKTTALKSVTSAFKKAGKSSGKKLTIKVKSSKKKAYKKLILKKGGNKKVKVK